MKKQKEDKILDMQDNIFNDKDEKELKKKDKTLKSMKKSLRRNSDFRYLTCNVGKGQKNGLRRLEIEEGDRVVTVCNKNDEVLNIAKSFSEKLKALTRTMIKHALQLKMILYPNKNKIFKA